MVYREELTKKCLGRRPEHLLLISFFVLKQFLVQFSARIATFWARANLLCWVIEYLEVGYDLVHMSSSVPRIISYHS
jgi:hypothetical protein